MNNALIAFFKRLRPQQRQRLLLTAVGTLVAVVGLYFGLIRAQQSALKSHRDTVSQCEDDLRKAKRLIELATKFQQELQDAATKLTAVEQTMAPPQHDLYAWMLTVLSDFRKGHKVEILHVTPSPPGEVALLPTFPYAAFTAAVDGFGRFHDIGKFIADFENAFPYFRIQNVQLNPPVGTPSAEEGDTLSFKLEIVALIAKSAAPR